jgi:hypothetical protein
MNGKRGISPFTMTISRFHLGTGFFVLFNIIAMNNKGNFHQWEFFLHQVLVESISYGEFSSLNIA